MASTVKDEPNNGKRKADGPVAVDSRCLRRLMKEVQCIEKDNPWEEFKIKLAPLDDNDLFVWSAKLHYNEYADDPTASETQRRLGQQCKKRGLEFIELRIVVPKNYPGEAPFVMMYYPRMIGGFIFSEGGLCMETLSTEYGWSAANGLLKLILLVKGMLEDGGMRVQTEDPDTKEKPYDEAGARRDLKAINNIHSSGWGSHKMSH